MASPPPPPVSTSNSKRVDLEIFGRISFFHRFNNIVHDRRPLVRLVADIARINSAAACDEVEVAAKSGSTAAAVIVGEMLNAVRQKNASNSMFHLSSRQKMRRILFERINSLRLELSFVTNE